MVRDKVLIALGFKEEPVVAISPVYQEKKPSPKVT
jgi:hypothetical protein